MIDVQLKTSVDTNIKQKEPLITKIDFSYYAKYRLNQITFHLSIYIQ